MPSAKADEEKPAEPVATQKIAIKKRQGTHYLLAESNQVWICGPAGIRRFRVQMANATFAEDGVANNLDAFMGPMSLIGDSLFHIRRRNQSSLVSISAVNPRIAQGSLANRFRGPPGRTAHEQRGHECRHFGPG